MRWPRRRNLLLISLGVEGGGDALVGGEPAVIRRSMSVAAARGRSRWEVMVLGEGLVMADRGLHGRERREGVLVRGGHRSCL